MNAQSIRIDKDIFSDRIFSVEFDINELHARNLKRLWLASRLTQD